MKIAKVIEFNEEDVKAMTHLRAHIFHPICDLLENRCQFCPFNEACANLEEFFDKAITDKQWFVPDREE